jgi:ribonuclease III
LNPELFQEFSKISSQLDELNLSKLGRFFPDFEHRVLRLEKIQSYKYRNKKLAIASLIHRSALVFWPMDKNGIMSNEKLEYLGDSFLSFFSAVECMVSHAGMNEGELSKLRAAIVGTENLSRKSSELGIGELLMMGKGESQSFGQKRENALADAFESVAAALLLDGGLGAARNWLMEVFASDLMIGKETLLQFDAKTRFQQWTQSIVFRPPTYRVVGSTSTPQNTDFLVAAFLGEHELARASGRNKREASKRVAEILQSQVESGELTEKHILSMFTNSEKEDS